VSSQLAESLALQRAFSIADYPRRSRSSAAKVSGCDQLPFVRL
jgi:hypothetical protein